MGARSQPPQADVAVGLAATAVRLGGRVWRVALLPARVAARLPVVEPVVLGTAQGLASAGREAQASGRRRVEEAGLGDEAIERLAHRLLESPAFERILREAAASRVTRDLLDEAARSSELQRVLEEVLSGPAVRNALTRETQTLWSEVAARLREATARLDDSVERVARRTLGRAERAAGAAEGGYAGLGSRGLGFVVDAAITQLTALAVGGLVGLLGGFLGLSAPDVVVAVLAGAGWAVFVGGYFALFWTTVGQTPGMRLAGVRVDGPGGDPPTLGRSLLRFVGLLLALAPCGLGLVPVLFDRRRRALQDYLARTVVVHDGEPTRATA